MTDTLEAAAREWVLQNVTYHPMLDYEKAVDADAKSLTALLSQAVKAEREACATLVESLEINNCRDDHEFALMFIAKNDTAKAIRSRAASDENTK